MKGLASKLVMIIASFITFLSSVLVAHVSPVRATESLDPQKSQARYVAEVEKQLSRLASERVSQNKLGKLKELRKFVSEEKERARKDLERAEKEKRPASEVRLWDEIDTEAVKLMLAFELVFEKVLSNQFMKDREFRARTCRDLPGTIRFDELAGKPDGTELGIYRQLAIRALNEFCT